MNTTDGVIFVHAVAKASIDSIDELILRLKIRALPYEWQLQPLLIGSVKTQIDWSARADAAPELVTELMQLPNIRFEVIQNHGKHQLGRRWSHSPGVGVFSAAIDEAGNQLISEGQVRNALYGSNNDLLRTQAALRKLLGTAWDDDLERFRMQQFEAPKLGMLGLG